MLMSERSNGKKGNHGSRNYAFVVSVVGLFVGVLLLSKKRDHQDIRRDRNLDQRVADFHTKHVLTGVGSTPAVQDGVRQRDAA
jgi:hypothetical protein